MSTIPAGLTSEEVDRVLAGCDRQKVGGLRACAVLTLLVRLALRRGEVAALTLDDLDWERGEWLVRGKGSKQACLPMPSDVGEALVAYLQVRSAVPWMTQIARNLTDSEDGFLRGTRYLILDRDPLYTAAFRSLLKDAGVEALRLPARSPNLNAYAERFVLSIKPECLDRIVPLSENHLRRTIQSYVEHYHGERHHQGLDGKLIIADDTAGRPDGHVACRERLGGTLNFYYREAA
jgi:hypothetical protein